MGPALGSAVVGLAEGPAEGLALGNAFVGAAVGKLVTSATTVQSAWTSAYTLGAMDAGTYRMLAAKLQGAYELDPNAPEPMLMTLVGNVMDVNEVHCQYAVAPIEVIDVDNSIDVNESQK